MDDTQVVTYVMIVMINKLLMLNLNINFNQTLNLIHSATLLNINTGY